MGTVVVSPLQGAVRVDGVEVAYMRVGAGPPAIMVHGAAQDGRLWQPQLAALAEDFHAVAWDEPGAGRSDDLPAGFRLADYAGSLAGLVEGLALGPVHVVGLSWGSTVSLELYRLRPDLVRTLVLVGAYAGWKGSLPADEVRTRVEGVRRMLAAPPEKFDPTLPGLFATGPPAEFRSLLRAMARDVRPAAFGAQLELMAEADLNDVLPRIAVPTLLLWGAEDARSPVAVARHFEETIPDARLVLVPQAGHVVNLERPDEFNDALRAFLRAHGDDSR